MSIQAHFEKQKQRLSLLINQFSISNPLLLKFINKRSRDPDVDRLIDALIYLFGKLDASNEIQSTELDRSFMTLLWPHLSRPIPSLTIVQFSAPISTDRQKNELDGISSSHHSKSPKSPITIPENCELVSNAQSIIPDLVSPTETIDDMSICAQFRTVAPVVLTSFENVSIEIKDSLPYISSHDVIEIQLNTRDLTPFTQDDLENLTFYLGDNFYSGKQLFLWMNKYLIKSEILINGVVYPQNQLSVISPALNNEQALIPYPKNVFKGYRLLHEYFAFPENYLFMKFAGIDLPDYHFTENCLIFRFTFNRELPSDLNLNNQSIKLNCIPAINLFEHDAEPITVNGQEINYPLIPKYNARAYFDVFSVDHVEGFISRAQTFRRRRIYSSFESFHHQSDNIPEHISLYYQLRTESDLSRGGFKHQLAFVRQDEKDLIGDDEIVSIKLTCTNKSFPAQLGVGQINQFYENNDSTISVRNISRPTLPLYPILEPYLHETLISSMTLNSSSLLSKESLIAIISMYDLASLYDESHALVAEQRKNAIHSLNSEVCTLFYQGLPVEGIHTLIKIKQSGCFESEGDLYLFGSVIAHFLSLYANVNTFHKLTIINLDNQEHYSWLPHADLVETLVS